MTDRRSNVVKRTMEIELLGLDLTTCGRCTGSARNLAEAIEAVAPVLRQTGIDVRVTRHVVTTAAQAEQLRFAASPTIRIDVHDIAPDFRQTNCNECADLCGCDGVVDCRVWIWEGREHLEAPRGMIIDALLKAYVTGPANGPPAAFSLPENLRRFFARKHPSQPIDAPASADVRSPDCCDRTTCCDDDSIADCCEDRASASQPAGTEAACGCR